MHILEYNAVDPLEVTFLNELALGLALTPEKVAHIRHTDPRPFPWLALYGEQNGLVVGQVGACRLPLVSREGREEVGGIWAVATHPGHARRGVASRLLGEAHARMRLAGLRFSVLATDRYCAAYQLYRQQGYQEMAVWGTALARWETAHQPTRLRAQPAGAGGHDLVERLYQDIAPEYLGFAYRPAPFAPLRAVSPSEIWLLHENDQPVGYAFARPSETRVVISNLTVRIGVDAAEAVAALAAGQKSAYIEVKTSRPVERASLQRAGYHVAHPDWSGFMVKPLFPGVTAGDARRLFGMGTDRFLISWLDLP